MSAPTEKCAYIKCDKIANPNTAWIAGIGPNKTAVLYCCHACLSMASFDGGEPFVQTEEIHHSPPHTPEKDATKRPRSNVARMRAQGSFHIAREALAAEVKQRAEEVLLNCGMCKRRISEDSGGFCDDTCFTVYERILRSAHKQVRLTAPCVEHKWDERKWTSDDLSDDSWMQTCTACSAVKYGPSD